MVTSRRLFLEACVFATLALLWLLACGPPPATSSSEPILVISPCRTVGLTRDGYPYDDRGRCWVSMRGESGALYQHPFKSAPEACPFACDRAGTIWLLTEDGKPPTVLGVVWKGEGL